MVADRVTVLSRMHTADAADGVKWESDGQGEFTVEAIRRKRRAAPMSFFICVTTPRSSSNRISSARSIKQYSDFIDHPVVIDVEKEKDGNKTSEEETLNSRKAIWLRPKSEIKQEEYDDVLQTGRASDFEAPLKTIHVAAEGAMEFKAL